MHAFLTASSRFPVCLALLASLAASACARHEAEGPAPARPPEPATSPAPAAEAVYSDVAAALGVRFFQDPGLDGSQFMPEIMGSGVGILDYDGDGRLDLYFVNGGPHDYPWKGDGAANHLLHQESDGTFRDVSEESGLDDRGYGMGVAVGDADNDGDPDVYITNYGPDAFYRNNGDGTFTEDTRGAGLGNSRWGTSAAFFDYDLDGWLDLFVANYLAYDPARMWTTSEGNPVYCAPDSFPGEADRLFHNNGDGTFSETSGTAGIARRAGKGLGVACADLTGDGLPDIYVANDGEPNFLWVNRGDGTFTEEGAARGGAVNEEGRSEASMGVALGDADGDGELDLFLTHLSRETNTLYLRHPSGGFRDATVSAGLALSSVPYTGFGTVFLDYDQDGDLDLVAFNGKVFPQDVDPAAVTGRDLRPSAGLNRIRWTALLGHPLPPPEDPSSFRRRYGEPAQLFENLGNGTFREVPRWSMPAAVSRGAACGDLDGDGSLDLVVTDTFGAARVLRNVAERKGSWLIVRAVDPLLHRDALGAIVTIREAGRRQVRPVVAALGYLSSSDPRVHFGLGDARTFEGIEVLWPGGDLEGFDGGPVNRVLLLERGAGRILRRRDRPAPPAETPESLPPPPGLPARLPADLPDPDLAGLDAGARSRIQASRRDVVSRPEDGNAWGGYGMLLHSHGFLREATLSYVEAGRLDPKDPRWGYLRGVLLLEQDPSRALESLESSLGVRPGYVPALVRKGHALAALGRNEESRGAYLRALALSSRCTAAHLGLARLAAAAGRREEAVLLAEAAARIDPEDPRPLRDLARFHRLAGEEQAAEAAERRASSLTDEGERLDDPDLAQVMELNASSAWRIGQARLLASAGRLRDAQEQLDAALRLDPRSAPALNLRSVVRRALGDYAGEAQDLEAAIRSAPDYSFPYVNRASARAAAGDLRGAIEDLDRALALDAYSATALLNRALVRRGLGLPDGALADLDRLLQIQPDSPQALRARGTIRRETGDLNGAEEDFRRLRRIQEASPSTP